MDITLVAAIFGMGNQNHEHVHRHNTLNLTTQAIDKLKEEQYAGGVLPSTLNTIANQSGSLSARPQGMVSIEDGFNIRRGIGLLRFQIEGNSLTSSELSVLGYLTGGGATEGGIEDSTMFVPVRSWTTDTRSVANSMGLPDTKTVVSSSTQFLLGDPNQVKDLKSARPIDVGNELLGFMACEEENNADNYDGILNADLKRNVIVSKTDNLNPTHHSRELLRIATQASIGSDYGGHQNAIADSLVGAGIGEMGITENEFFRTMMYSLGMHSLNGFGGFSIGEINGVFNNFLDVLNLTLLNPNSFIDSNNLFNSNEYGSASAHEIICSEMAMITVHLLMRVGLTHIKFAATNNPHDTGGIVGSEDGIEIIPAEFGSVLENDDYAINRVEEFKYHIKNQFFSKYSTGYIHSSTIMNIEVHCSIFGETRVAVFLNGDPSNQRSWVNATYCINRTSSNIAGTAVGLNESKQFMQNIKDYFI